MKCLRIIVCLGEVFCCDSLRSFLEMDYGEGGRLIRVIARRQRWVAYDAD